MPADGEKDSAYLVVAEFEDGEIEGILVNNLFDAGHAKNGGRNGVSVVAEDFYEAYGADSDCPVRILKIPSLSELVALCEVVA
jgi:hypothetical protein